MDHLLVLALAKIQLRVHQRGPAIDGRGQQDQHRVRAVQARWIPPPHPPHTPAEPTCHFLQGENPLGLVRPEPSDGDLVHSPSFGGVVFQGSNATHHTRHWTAMLKWLAVICIAALAASMLAGGLDHADWKAAPPKVHQHAGRTTRRVSALSYGSGDRSTSSRGRCSLSSCWVSHLIQGFWFGPTRMCDSVCAVLQGTQFTVPEHLQVFQHIPVGPSSPAAGERPWPEP